MNNYVEVYVVNCYDAGTDHTRQDYFFEKEDADFLKKELESIEDQDRFSIFITTIMVS